MATRKVFSKMTLHKCPRCGRIVSVMPGAGNRDFVHDCNSGNDALDQEDVVDLTKPQWNLQGVQNRASVKARIEGADVEDLTDRGNRKSTHTTRQHQEFIELQNNNIITTGG
jgi:hypothetical protein